jgi:hypothetical protein
MSDFGPFRTSRGARLESAKGGTADIASGFRRGRFIGRPHAMALKDAIICAGLAGGIG